MTFAQPDLFLADTARAYSVQPPEAWDGVIEMVDK
jgi:hypothetical protein